MKSTVLVPEIHHEHARHAGLLDWVTVALWLVVSVGFVVSLRTPAWVHAVIDEEPSVSTAPAAQPAPHAMATNPCQVESDGTRG
jgi:hypothetical protein